MVVIRRFIIEFGLGIDIHGQDVNKAAQKAVKDAISKSCLIGLDEILNFQADMDEKVFINVTVAVSRPEEVNEEDIKLCLPVGQTTVKAIKGGLTVPGFYYPRFGDKDESIEAAIACVEVSIK